MLNTIEPSYPEGNFEGNQLLDGSIGLSPLCRAQATRFARQNSDQLPPQFPMASLWNSIVHHLSGPMDLASTQNPVHWTADPVIPCRGPRPGLIGLPSPRTEVSSEGIITVCTTPRANSIDSLVRVSRRAEGGTAEAWPSSTALQHRIPSGGPATSGRPPSEWCSHRAVTEPQPLGTTATWSSSGDNNQGFWVCVSTASVTYGLLRSSLLPAVDADGPTVAPEWGRCGASCRTSECTHSTTKPWALTSRLPPQGLPRVQSPLREAGAQRPAWG